MPSSRITADETGPAYWAKDLSAGGSGVIFRGKATSARTLPDSLGILYPLTLLRPSLYKLKISIIGKINQ
jgi:hypothetical protein